MPYIFSQPVREHAAPYVVFESLFSAEECKKIIDLRNVLQKNDARVGGGNADKMGDLNAEKRVTDLYWIEWSPDYDWIFDRISNAVMAANAKWWGFHLSGMAESMQLTHYRSDKAGHYDWHEDHGDSGSFQHRKLSTVMQLNDGFEGGSFELFHAGKLIEMKPGTMVIFPSYKTHRVTPVTAGERWSLVTWISGPAFV